MTIELVKGVDCCGKMELVVFIIHAEPIHVFSDDVYHVDGK